ncbi:putative toxin-antitoxin system toxin component, PIN family [Thiocapsa sp.]|uniref:putative toxin-antitoxin system toxin component, PIN family n=1 Tax=Thiocapsa sp. TaxID=2024551 RepID=UPI0035942EAF
MLDTNIVISGLIWGGMPRRLLDLARDGRVTLFTSSVLLDELAEVIARSKFEAMLTSQDFTPAFLIQRYGMLARLVTPRAIERIVRDADDDAVIATALAAQADVIVTGDYDLLTLRAYNEIQILNPADAVHLVSG